jgi:hypothetical protein
LESIRGREGDSVAKPTGEFLESDFQLPVKRRAAVLLERPLCDEQRQQFALREVHGGKRRDGFGVAIRLDIRTPYAANVSRPKQ